MKSNMFFASRIACPTTLGGFTLARMYAFRMSSSVNSGCPASLSAKARTATVSECPFGCFACTNCRSVSTVCAFTSEIQPVRQYSSWYHLKLSDPYILPLANQQSPLDLQTLPLCHQQL